ncbi:SMP-30/gluconolactonase/LRE family protein [Agrobacterium tumefaciens]|nr:SMP-30/gluconolactonase/LRE family protein [Agrobacterium tumefaciens]
MSPSGSGSFPIYKAERIGSFSCTLGESPVWNPADETVTFVDSACSRVHQIHIPTGAMKDFEFPLPVSALALTEEGNFIASTSLGFAILTIDRDDAKISSGIGPALATGWRMNDSACDRQGRYWSGSMAPDTSAPDGWGTMFSLDATGKVVERGGRYRTQNGLGFSLDGRRIYVSDSHRSNPHVMAYDFDCDSGEMTNGRLFADHAHLGGRPDGAAIDADDCYWIAASDSGRLLRLTPQGKIDAAIEVDVPNPTNLCFMGADLDMVFITTLKPGGTGPGGHIYMAKVPHKGAANAVFSGAARLNLPNTQPGMRLSAETGADQKPAE